MIPHYEDKVVVLRIPKGTGERERAAAIKETQILAKSHNSESRAYRTDWAKYHRNKNQISLL